MLSDTYAASEEEYDGEDQEYFEFEHAPPLSALSSSTVSSKHVRSHFQII